MYQYERKPTFHPPFFTIYTPLILSRHVIETRAVTLSLIYTIPSSVHTLWGYFNFWEQHSAL